MNSRGCLERPTILQARPLSSSTWEVLPMVWTSHENNRSSDSAKYARTFKEKNMVGGKKPGEMYVIAEC